MKYIRTQKLLHFSLNFQNRVLYEIDELKDGDEIVIGRSSSCTWIIPSDDHLASGKHAVLLSRKGKIFIKDLGSKNGIFFHGEKFSEKSISSDEEYLIGNCILKIEKSKQVKKKTCSSLLFVNSLRRGEHFLLSKSMIKIGSGMDCDLVISDSLISSVHAIISCAGNECWIQDHNSSNGTRINGSSLKDTTQRLLKEGDIISISYIDLKFLDGSIEHSPLKIFKTLTIFVLTAFIALAGYWFYSYWGERSEKYLEQARFAAEKEHFDVAFNYLSKAKTSSNAALYKMQIENLQNAIESWKQTIEQWEKAKQFLSSENWIEASRVLGQLESRGTDVWDWNIEASAQMKKEMKNAKILIDFYFESLNEGNSMNLRDIKTDLFLKADVILQAQNPSYLEKLKITVKKSMDQDRIKYKQIQELNQILRMLDLNANNYPEIISRLERLMETADGNIKLRIRKCLEPLILLQAANNQLRSQIIYVYNMDFEKARKVQLDLPSAEFCSAEQHLSSFRKKIEMQQRIVCKAAIRLNVLSRNLTQVFGNTISPEVFWGDFKNPDIVKKVFSCDSLSLQLPRRGRNIPVGEYDRILGIDIFYDFLTTLPETYQIDENEDLTFLPEIVRIKKSLNDLDLFCKYMEMPNNRWLHRGKILRFLKSGENILKQRDSFVQDFLNYKGDPRTEIISHGIGLFIYPNNDYPVAVVENIIKKMRILRNLLLPINREYNEASSERQIVIRNTILERGLPGDPLVRRMWAFK